MSGQGWPAFPLLTQRITDTNQLAGEGVMLKFCPKCQRETERYKSKDCKPCAKAMVTAYRAANPELAKSRYRSWIAANKDRVKATSAAYREANKDRIKLVKSLHYAANAERIKAKTAAWGKANPERARALSVAWKKANPDKVKAGAAAYLQSNLGKHRVNQHTRRARKSKAGGKLSQGLSDKLFILQKGKCPCCKRPLGDDFHLDHIMPLALGGTNTDCNIQLLRAKCNVSKGAKHPTEFMQRRGFLL